MANYTSTFSGNTNVGKKYLVAIAADVSASMKTNAPVKNTGVKGGAWSRSIIQVVDDLIKIDFAQEDVFVAGFGTKNPAVPVSDVLNSIPVSSYTPGSAVKDNQLNEIYQLLEEAGALTIRSWASKEIIKSVLQANEAEQFLVNFRMNKEFSNRFIDEVLPVVCRDTDRLALQKLTGLGGASLLAAPFVCLCFGGFLGFLLSMLAVVLSGTFCSIAGCNKLDVRFSTISAAGHMRIGVMFAGLGIILGVVYYILTAHFWLVLPIVFFICLPWCIYSAIPTAEGKMTCTVCYLFFVGMFCFMYLSPIVLSLWFYNKTGWFVTFGDDAITPASSTTVGFFSSIVRIFTLTFRGMFWTSSIAFVCSIIRNEIIIKIEQACNVSNRYKVLVLNEGVCGATEGALLTCFYYGYVSGVIWGVCVIGVLWFVLTNAAADHLKPREVATKEDIESIVAGGKKMLKFEFKPLSRDSVVSAKRASDIIHQHVDSKDNNDMDDKDNKKYEDLMAQIEPAIYGGSTPMYLALMNAASLISEIGNSHTITDKLLFVVSDGKASDTHMADGCIKAIANLKQKGVIVVCCFVYNQDRAVCRARGDESGIKSKHLYFKAEHAWPEPAKAMFNLSSKISTSAIPRTLFVKRDWTIEIDAKNNETSLFLHVNHPDHIRDACDLAKNVVCGHDALVDLLADATIDQYITQTIESHKRDHSYREQECETCYAHASATVIHLALGRILRPANQQPKFEDILSQIIGKYGRKPQKTFNVLKEFCHQRYTPALHVSSIKLLDALNAVVAKRPVVATFGLKRKEWEAFDLFFDPVGWPETSTSTLTKEYLDLLWAYIERNIKNNPSASPSWYGKFNENEELRHAVVLVGFDSKGLRFMNSLGLKWGNTGFFTVQNADVLRGMEFYDVNWNEADLTSKERQEYKKQGAKEAKVLIEKYRSLSSAVYQCPKCRKSSPVSDFSGYLGNVACPVCKNTFRCTGGNVLAMNIYLTSLMVHAAPSPNSTTIEKLKEYLQLPCRVS